MLLLIYYCAAAVLLWRGLFHVLNHMNRHTCNAARFAWLFVTTGAAQILLAPAFGTVPAPSFGDAVLLAGVAWYFIANHSKGKT